MAVVPARGSGSRRGSRTGLGPRWPRPALVLPALAVAVALGGCGGDDAEPAPDSDSGAAEPVRLIQSARSGSFLGGSGGELHLVLRGVGGTTTLDAAGPDGGAAGAIATAKLLRDAGTLLGPEPLRARLSGAEVEPLGYSLLLSDGSYNAGVGAITYRAEVEAGQPDLPPGSFGAATLTIDSGLPAETLAGTVVEAGGERPLAGALISVEVGGLGIATVPADSEGRFELGPLPAGSYRVEATLSGYERDAAVLELPASVPPRLELTPIGAG